MVPLVSLTKGLVLVGRGGLIFPAKESPHRVRSPSSRRCHVLAGRASLARTLPGFRALVVACEREGENRRSPSLSSGSSGIVGPIRSKWSCSKRRRFGKVKSRAVSNLQLPSRAGRSGS